MFLIELVCRELKVSDIPEVPITFELIKGLSFESMLIVKISYTICSFYAHKRVTLSGSAKRSVCLRTTSSQRN